MEIALIVLSIISISFLIAYLSVSRKLNSINKGFAQLFIAYNTLKETVDNKPTKTEEDIHKENFIKFLSDSRDWAFDYIEDVQKGLTHFISEIEPSINYFKEYGIVIEGAPNYKDMKKISEEFEKLKGLLPQDINDRR